MSSHGLSGSWSKIFFKTTKICLAVLSSQMSLCALDLRVFCTFVFAFVLCSTLFTLCFCGHPNLLDSYWIDDEGTGAATKDDIEPLVKDILQKASNITHLLHRKFVVRQLQPLSDTRMVLVDKKPTASNTTLARLDIQTRTLTHRLLPTRNPETRSLLSYRSID